MTYDPIDTSASDDTADSSATIDEIDATVLQGLNLDTVDAGRPVIIEEENGQTVFTTPQLPVAYGNLVQWYPFDSSEYGGNNADDVTAILGGSGDDTAFDGTVNGATYNSTDGVTDINKGQNSGAFEFDGIDDSISVDSRAFGSGFSIAAFVKRDTAHAGEIYSGRDGDGSTPKIILSSTANRKGRFFVQDQAGTEEDLRGGFLSDNGYGHVAGVFDNNTVKLFVDGSQVGSATNSFGNFPKPDIQAFIGSGFTSNTFNEFNGTIDDLRIYNKALSSSEVSQIVSNTQP